MSYPSPEPNLGNPKRARPCDLPSRIAFSDCQRGSDEVPRSRDSAHELRSAGLARMCPRGSPASSNLRQDHPIRRDRHRASPPEGMPAAKRIFRATAPTIAQPARFSEMAASATRVLAPPAPNSPGSKSAGNCDRRRRYWPNTRLRLGGRVQLRLLRPRPQRRLCPLVVTAMNPPI